MIMIYNKTSNTTHCLQYNTSQLPVKVITRIINVTESRQSLSTARITWYILPPRDFQNMFIVCIVWIFIVIYYSLFIP